MRDYKSDEFKQEVFEKRMKAFSNGERRCELCKYCEEIWKERTVGIFNRRKEKYLAGHYCHIIREFISNHPLASFSDCKGSFTIDDDKVR